MDRRYDSSNLGDGFEGFFKSLEIERCFKVKNSNNFRICKQVENNVINLGRT